MAEHSGYGSQAGNLFRLRLFSIIIFLIIQTNLTSCNNVRDGYIASNKVKEINLDSAIKHYSIADQVTDVHSVDLETNESSVISDAYGVQKVIFHDKKFFVLDIKYMGIKVFASSGKYLYSIGKLGMGKGEFVRLEDMIYSPVKNSLFVLCNRPSKIIEFSLDGNIIQDQRLNFWASGIQMADPNTRIFYVNQNRSVLSKDKNILWTDSSNLLKIRMFDLPKHISTAIKFSGGIFHAIDGIYYNPPFSSTYYLLINDTALPKFKIDYGVKSIPTDPQEDDVLDNMKKYSFQFGTFVKNDRYFGFNYFQSKMESAFVNLQSGNIMTSDIRTDSLNLLFSNSVFDVDGNYLMVLDINKLTGFIKRNRQNIQNRFPNLFDSLNFEKIHKNPVLLSFKLKSI